VAISLRRRDVTARVADRPPRSRPLVAPGNRPRRGRSGEAGRRESWTGATDVPSGSSSSNIPRLMGAVSRATGLPCAVSAAADADQSTRGGAINPCTACTRARRRAPIARSARTSCNRSGFSACVARNARGLARDASVYPQRGGAPPGWPSGRTAAPTAPRRSAARLSRAAKLLPLDRPGRLARDIERHPADGSDLVDHPRGDRLGASRLAARGDPRPWDNQPGASADDYATACRAAGHLSGMKIGGYFQVSLYSPAKSSSQPHAASLIA
jgi:hypothetical protein